jgi:hypothetical protein
MSHAFFETKPRTQQRSRSPKIFQLALACALGASAVWHQPVSAEEPTAQQIADRLVRGDTSSWIGAKTRVRMALTQEGKTQERSLEFVGRRKDGKYQGLVTFLSPADVAGTAFLMLEHGPGNAEQYIYLPALKRTRRIAGRERDGSFMGSDFTYADMQGVDAKSGSHQRLKDENVGNDACYVLETTIKPDAKVAYAKVMTWVRKTDYVALRTKFFDASGKLVKTLYTRRVKQIDGSPVVMESRMQTEANSHATDIFVDSLERRDDLPDAQFTPAALEHL